MNFGLTCLEGVPHIPFCTNIHVRPASYPCIYVLEKGILGGWLLSYIRTEQNMFRQGGRGGDPGSLVGVPLSLDCVWTCDVWVRKRAARIH